MTATATTLTAAQIRSAFIDYFRETHGHAFAPSSPVVPHDDPTLLFTNAGMNQFKDVFLATGSREYSRAVNTQKCIRAGGKHNDLEDVGRDTYHHTFFEMLGNWSFGDYFKQEAIDWAWELLTKVWGLDPQRMYVTVFEGAPDEGTEADTEAEQFWAKHVPADRISRWGKKDNFWEMGETGPCGPCTEIHYDSRPDAERERTPGADLVNRDHPDVIEIWNLVFIQFNRGDDGTLTPLPAKHVDTGMGLERIVRVIQGKRSNYDTDIWTPIFAAIEKETGAQPYGGETSGDDPVDVAYRVIADHIRCLTVAITDGAQPGNEGRNYVLRRILRRAVRMAHQTLGVEGPVLCRLVPAVVETLGTAFPELTKDPQRMAKIIEDEEKAFLRTLDRGIALFTDAAERASNEFVRSTGDPMADDYARTSIDGPLVDWTGFRGKGRPVVSGEDAFNLHDTYGFPIDLTRLMAEERGMTVDEDEYARLMDAARARSRAGGGGESDGGDVFDLPPEAIAKLKFKNITPTDDVDKYHGRPITATIRAIWNGSDFDHDSLTVDGSDVDAIVLDKTNFYAEQGGQIADTGTLRDVDGDRSEFEVLDTRNFGGYVVHIGRLKKGELNVGEAVQVMINRDRRNLIMANHTATHLLNLALRDVLRDETIDQKGSLVAADRLRFDFSCGRGLKAHELADVEQHVNERISSDLEVFAQVVPLEDAQKIRGLRAVFGERYPDPVRVVSVGQPVDALITDPENDQWAEYSIEFCGGTHLASTELARRLVIVQEGALAAGIRRITAVTGPAAQAAYMAAMDLLGRIDNAAELDGSAFADEVAAIAQQTDEVALSASARVLIKENLKPLQEKVKQQRKADHAAARGNVVDQARTIAEESTGRLVIARLDGADKDTLLNAVDVIRSKRDDAAAMLFAGDEDAGKVAIVAMVPKPMIGEGLKAGDWVRVAAQACGGGGGGRADMAQAGGKNIDQIPAAMIAAQEFAEEKLS